MHKWKILKKAAPLFLSAAMAMTNLPVNVFAADIFSSGEIFEETFTEGEAVSEEEIFFAGNTETEEFSSEEEVSVEDVQASESGYKYVYAGISWNDFWASEGVYAAGNAAASSEADSKGEYDKGGFDAITRATVNHGLHRGSFQCIAVIYDEDGNSYPVSYWEGKDTVVLTDGSKIGFSRGTITTADGIAHLMDHYEIKGIKYVPVRVSEADYEDFCTKYPVTESGESIAGGYAEVNLVSYQKTAEINENTNGLKIAVKNGNGYTFSTRKQGNGSGIQGEAQKKASGIEVSVREASGSYGEFLRVDLNGNYGDLGSNMYAVRWDYFGDDSTCTNKLASYGTKFAADNWMHKSMGIQLGLTESIRCKLPGGTNGTGYWKLTVYAMGYEDYSFVIKATEENIVNPAAAEVNVDELALAIEKAEALNETAYTAESWNSLKMELQEAKDELAAPHSQAAVDEALSHLKAAMEALKKIEYILMNIPYAQFYAADLNNNVAVDAMTSATLNKTRTGSMVGGSYHVDPNGTDITGVTFPVKIQEGVDLSGYTQVTDENSVDISVTNRGQTTTTTYTGSAALFESPSYSYYVLKEAPEFYKEMKVNADGSLSFGEIVGETTKISGTAELLTKSNYGDYQLNISGVQEYIASSDTIYGVVIGTKEGAEYGLRHMENIWFGTALSWCTGFTSVVHNCPTSSEHYKAMMGQTIDKVTYYTANGIFEIDLADMYVPVKFAGEVTAADASVTSGKTALKLENFPADFSPVYSIEGLEMNVSGNEIHFANAAKGIYTLKVSDANGKYADMLTSFNLYTDIMPAAYDQNAKAIKLTATATAADFANYIQNISSVSVNGTSYAPVGKHSVLIINDDGSIKTDAAPLAEAGFYDITIKATGYKDLSFVYANGVAKIELNKTDLTLFVNKTESLTTETAGEGEAVVYTSSDSAVATVDANGKITAKREGKAVITAVYGNASASCNVTVNASLKAAKSNVTLDLKGTKTATVKGILTGAKSGAKVTYKSGNTKVAKVDANGKITAVGAGKTTISMSYKTTGKTIKANCNVTVKGFKLNKTSVILYTKGSSKTKLEMTKTGISGSYKFKSSNSSVASVSSNGTITAKKAGTATITVTCGSYKQTCKVTVKKPVLTVKKTSISVKVGKTSAIKATATPAKKITYKSSNKAIATVSSNGVVKGIKKGTAKITVTCNGVSKTITVNVK